MTATLLHLRPYQRECIDAINKAWSDGMQRPAVVLATGLGKGHPAHTEVPTPDGIRKWGDLRPGDKVFGTDGRPTVVVDVYERGVLPTFLVSFSDGSSVEVDGDHLWSVRDRKYRSTSREERTLSTADLASGGLRHGPSYRFQIPVTGAVKRPDADLPIDPYTLGSLIANGYLSGTGTQLTTPDDEVIGRIRRSHSVNRINDTSDGVCPRYSLPGLSRPIRDLGLNVLSAQKHIPENYLNAPVRDRISLLRGLMDGDGSSRPGGRRSVIYHTTSSLLTGDVVELVTSLGGTASPKWYRRLRNGKISDECQIFILMPAEIHPFHTSRRDRTDQPRRSFPPRRAIVSIDPIGNQKITCIRVSARDNLYLVTRAHIVTHNTVIFSHLISEFSERTGQRSVVLVHRDELADQAIGKLRDVAPHLNIGKVKAEDNETDADVLVCSVQTLAHPSRLAQLGPVGLVVADEVHHYASKTFRGVLAGLGCFRPDGPRMAGFTATLARGDGIGLGDVVDADVYRRGTMFGIKNGFLVPPEGRLVVTEGLDLSTVKRAVGGGDYAAGDLGRALEESGTERLIPGIYAEHASDRQGIVFTPTVATAQNIADEFTASGVSAAMVCGETPRDERLRIFDAYRRGRIQVMTNAMVLTEGFDMPQASCAVIARPTQSQPLYVQMVGRVLRPFPGKKDALILDVVGASVDNKLMTLVDLEPGLFPDPKPCLDCGRVPCVCPCKGCGLSKQKCECPKDTPDLELRSFGQSGVVDMFAASAETWLTTAGGVMFIPAGDGEVFLWPSQAPGLWDVAFAPKAGRWERLHTDLPMGTAMAWAETESEERTSFNTGKSASWRRTKPSEGQLKFAAQLGINASENIRKGELGNLISIKLATRKLDRYIKS